ncbi:Cell division protein FtsX [Candidatus Phaeomarinobacter ectocarpi]|uniref:Cell division protein FtsX n=2 Tax=Candidatus Phaeomarinibacter ectocarpi TaxID=1458461 RepID=X5M7T5_9HYPH|nr:Cell division protein FtsX [Candidatus Phaeomarinobacter ectocarpi]
MTGAARNKMTARSMAFAVTQRFGQRFGLTGPDSPDMEGLEPASDLMPRGRGGAALGVVIAGMCYLACLALGGALLTSDASRAWTQDLDRALTIQVVPRAGVDVEAEAQAVIALLEAEPKIASVEALPESASAALIEPWLGDSDALSGLPIPLLIHADMAPGATINLDTLRARLKAAAPNATLDTHARWRDELAGAATVIELVGMGILALVAITTAAIVVFATRSALAANRDTVEVLHLIGARDTFIAGEVQKRFLTTGLKAGLAGWGAATITFLLFGLSASDGAGIVSLLPQLQMPWTHYLILLAVPVAATALTAIAARMTVVRAMAPTL